MQQVTVATFNLENPAFVVRDQLEKNGIPASVVDERNVQSFWFFSKHYAGIRVKVEKNNFERAGDLLEKLDKEQGLMREAIRCPQCDSSRIEYPQMTRHFVLPTLFMQVGHLLGMLKMRFYCRNCQNTWLPRGREKNTEPKIPKPVTGN